MISLARPATYAALATALLAVLSLAAPASAQRAQGPEEVPVDQLMQATGGLPEIVLGPADAKVTIVEFYSLTCSHCRDFHKEVLPELKTKYIDTGKVRLVLRDHPGNDRAAAAAMLVRCSGDKAYPMIDALFRTQDQWAFVKESPLPKLLEISKQAGFTEESFNKCLKDDNLLKTINSNFENALSKFGARATPTIFINGKLYKGRPTTEGFDKAIAEAEPKS